MRTNRLYLWLLIGWALCGMSCSSTQEDAADDTRTDASLQLSFQLGDDPLLPSTSSTPLTLRVLLVEEYGGVRINQLFTRSEESTITIQLESLPKGIYDIYILGNERALGLDGLDQLQSRTEIEQLTAQSSRFQRQQGTPLVGVARHVRIEQDKQRVFMPIQRLLTGVELTISNPSGKPIQLEEVTLGNVYPTLSALFYEAQAPLSKEPISLSEALPLVEVAPYQAYIHRSYLPELVGGPQGITLSLTTAQHGKLTPIVLRRKSGQLVTQIERNSLLRIQVRIQNNQLIQLQYEVVDWDQEEIDIPVFS